MSWQKDEATKEGLQRGLEGRDSSQGLFSSLRSEITDESKDVGRARDEAYLAGLQTRADREATERATQEIKEHISRQTSDANSRNSPSSSDYDDSGSDYTSSKSTAASASKIASPSTTRNSHLGLVIGLFMLYLALLAIFAIPVDSPMGHHSSIFQWFIMLMEQQNKPAPAPQHMQTIRVVTPNQQQLSEQLDANLRHAEDEMKAAEEKMDPFLPKEERGARPNETPEQHYERFIKILREQEKLETPEQIHERTLKYLREHPNP